jgi:Voltage gated chloride channel
LVGGLFAPTLFFGGMLGALFHNIFAFLFVRIGRDLAELPAYAMIGSASFLASVFRAPLTGSLILFECTREYDVILPLMASAGWASVVADVLEIWKSSERKPREGENAVGDNKSDEEKVNPSSSIRNHEELDRSNRSFDESDKSARNLDESERRKRPQSRLEDGIELSTRKIEFGLEENGR